MKNLSKGIPLSEYYKIKKSEQDILYCINSIEISDVVFKSSAVGSYYSYSFCFVFNYNVYAVIDTSSRAVVTL